MMRLLLFFLILLSFSPGGNAQIFTEVSNEIGIDYVYPGNDFQMAGGGLMVIDVNNDGWEDFYQCGGVFPSKLWLNKGGTFIDATQEYGLDSLDGYFIQGAIGADYNNDGFQDFVIVNFGSGMGMGDKKSPVLLKNINGKSFQMISLEELLPAEDYASASWGDINNDGFVDLYLSNYVASMGVLQDSSGREIGYNPTCFENKLLLNIDGENFKESSEEYGINNGGCSLASIFTDIDNDGDVDLLLLNDFGVWTGEGNKYFRNNFPEKTFSDLSDISGFNHKMYGMSFGPGDYDLDGDIDYYITNIGQNYLFEYKNEGFTDVAMNLKLDESFAYDSVRSTSWSGLFFDLEFDGDLDLFISQGNIATLIPKTTILDSNKLFINNNGVFEDISESSGVADVLSHRGSVIFDYDHDGDLDIISSVVKLPWGAYANKEQKIKVYRNDTKSGNWIGIRLVGEGEICRDAFGTKILVEQNGKKHMKEVDAGTGHSSQSTRILYFGLGQDKYLQKATIFWLDGTTTQLSKLKKNRVYEVTSKGEVRDSMNQ
ncbi:MAG: CRTAC1 family protein [Fluviicola sp.]|nr:CRTAC1 family protein [Fluviicola sp.]